MANNNNKVRRSSKNNNMSYSTSNMCCLILVIILIVVIVKSFKKKENFTPKNRANRIKFLEKKLDQCENKILSELNKGKDVAQWRIKRCDKLGVKYYDLKNDGTMYTSKINGLNYNNNKNNKNNNNNNFFSARFLFKYMHLKFNYEQ